ncbi:hypothetical protein V8E52_008858 [Russula decolorans]
MSAPVNFKILHLYQATLITLTFLLFFRINGTISPSSLPPEVQLIPHGLYGHAFPASFLCSLSSTSTVVLVQYSSSLLVAACP